MIGSDGDENNERKNERWKSFVFAGGLLVIRIVTHKKVSS